MTDAEGVGMLFMDARKGADAVLAEEFIFIEHLCQDTAKSGFIKNGAEAASLLAGLSWVMDK